MHKCTGTCSAGDLIHAFDLKQNLPFFNMDARKKNVLFGFLEFSRSQEKPRSKTFRVSFSNVSSVITFEKAPFEREVSPAKSDCDAGYTLRNRPTKPEPEAGPVYTLRSRPVKPHNLSCFG